MIIAEIERLILRHFHVLDGEAMDRVYGGTEVMRFRRGVQTQQWMRDWAHSCLDGYYQKLGHVGGLLE